MHLSATIMSLVMAAFPAAVAASVSPAPSPWPGEMHPPVPDEMFGLAAVWPGMSSGPDPFWGFGAVTVDTFSHFDSVISFEYTYMMHPSSTITDTPETISDQFGSIPDQFVALTDQFGVFTHSTATVIVAPHQFDAGAELIGGKLMQQAPQLNVNASNLNGGELRRKAFQLNVNASDRFGFYAATFGSGFESSEIQISDLLIRPNDANQPSCLGFLAQAHCAEWRTGLRFSSQDMSSFEEFSDWPELTQGQPLAQFSADGSSLTLISPHTASVPGPLPVMGVGMALGWSRHLRRRFHQAKTYQL